jgi:hypothetical protein
MLLAVLSPDFLNSSSLKELENQLPDGTSIAEINIKMGSGSADWYATHGTFGYSDLVSDLSSSFRRSYTPQL